MKKRLGTQLIIPALCVLCGGMGPDFAAAEQIVYRFEAVRSAIRIAPPEGSLAARASSLPELSGTFGYEIGRKVTATAGIAERVSFASYDTGFIKVDGLDLGGISRPISVQVTDGVTQVGDPPMTIADEVLLATSAVSTEVPIDALSLRLRYIDADRLQDVGLPAAFRPDEMAEMRVTFSTRIDAVSAPEARQTATGTILGLVSFTITAIERVE